MNWQIKKFSEFTNNELYDIIKLRIDVFVVEQRCYYPELDNLDKSPETLHLFCYQHNHLAAYLRILPKHTSYIEHISIGRVVIAKNARGAGLGHKLIEQALALCGEHFPAQSIKISAQAHLESFYQIHGFERVTDVYLEDNIPHIGMINSNYNSYHNISE
ncbi:MAG: GNAT family N-acetyltransferase [Thalassotalea sp.]